MSTVYVTPEQVAAAKALVVLDEAQGRQSDEWTRRVAQADEDEASTRDPKHAHAS